MILVVAGVSLRAEEMDRPLAYRLADEIRERLGPDPAYSVLVVSDVLYLNDEALAACPIISIGGPGVNNLSAVLFRELSSVLVVDNVLIIQMDVKLADLRCCLWGVDHERTVEALEIFLKRGHLDHFLQGATAR